jgi:F-type H+-transporting ATPase subunit delta
VQLVSAQDLDADNKSRIERQVQDMTGQSIEVKYRVDPSLVAGATVRFGDVVIDGSLAGQLQSLKERYVVDLEQGKL